MQRLQLEQGMSYNATYFFEYMNTYADIPYGAYVHGSQYSRRSQIRLIARLLIVQVEASGKRNRNNTLHNRSNTTETAHNT